jgi:uncharacterized protein (TIGR02594 family)
MKPFEIALKEWGTKSISGVIHNPDVIKYFKEIGQSWVKDDETAWCAAFANWCLVKASRPQTRSLAARSFLTYGLSTKTPTLGDLVVLWRISPLGPFGHVGFYVKDTKDYVYILGGNQAGQVNIQGFPKTQLLDYRQIPLVH